MVHQQGDSSLEERVKELEQRLIVLERRSNFAQYVRDKGMTTAEVVVEWLRYNRTVKGSTLAIETDNMYTGAAYRQAIYRLALSGILVRTGAAGLYVLAKKLPAIKVVHKAQLEAAKHDWENGMSIKAAADKHKVPYSTLRYSIRS